MLHVATIAAASLVLLELFVVPRVHAAVAIGVHGLARREATAAPTGVLTPSAHHSDQAWQDHLWSASLNAQGSTVGMQRRKKELEGLPVFSAPGVFGPMPKVAVARGNHTQHQVRVTLAGVNTQRGTEAVKDAPRQYRGTEAVKDPPRQYVYGPPTLPIARQADYHLLGPKQELPKMMPNKSVKFTSQEVPAVGAVGAINAPYGPPPRVDPRVSTTPALGADVFGPKQQGSRMFSHAAPAAHGDADPAAADGPVKAGAGHTSKKAGGEAVSKNPSATDDQTVIGEVLQDEPLPPWACFALGAAFCMVILGIYACIRSRYYSPIPSGADSATLQEVLLMAKQKEQELKEELEERRELARLADEALITDGTAEEAAAAEARVRIRELREQADARGKEIHDAAERLSEQREALIAGANRVSDTFTEVLETARESVEDFTKAETRSVYEKMSEAAQANTSELPSWEPPDWLKSDDLIQIPPLMHLIMGMFAPAQLRSMSSYNSTVCRVTFIMLVVSAVVFAVDYQKTCHDIMVWVWQWGFLVASVLELLFRNIIVRWTENAMTNLEKSREVLERANATQTGNNLMDWFTAAKRGNSKFFEAYFKYSSITDSHLYFLTQIIGFFNLCWGGFGLYISIQDIVEDTLSCNARYALLYMHTYGFFYVMFLTWMLLGLVLWIVALLSGSKTVSKPLIKVSKSVDDGVNNGMPVCLTLIQSFVLKNSADALGLSVRQIKAELEELNEHIESAEEDLEKLRFKAERLEEIEAQIGGEAEFMERCQKKLQTGLDQARPLVGLIAANVSSTGGSGADPTASGSSSSSRRSSQASQDPSRPSLVAGRFSRVGGEIVPPLGPQAAGDLTVIDEEGDVESF